MPKTPQGWGALLFIVVVGTLSIGSNPSAWRNFLHNLNQMFWRDVVAPVFQEIIMPILGTVAIIGGIALAFNVAWKLYLNRPPPRRRELPPRIETPRLSPPRRERFWE